MSDRVAWDRLRAARVGRFATTAPRIVPVTFAVAGETLYHAIDHKPKATRALARLADLRRDPRASLLVDHYDEDWSALWWVRADGRARILEDGFDDALDLLAAKYPQYAERRPEGPVVALDVERLATWDAARADRARSRP